jgi:predicted MFS family arabinose efflux permease
VLGDNEQLVAQGSAFVQAATQITQLVGPILAGVLIAWLSAPAVLLVDAATYAFSFVVVLTFVRAGARIAPDESSRGLFAGLRYVLRDKLLGPTLAAAAFINFAAQGLFAMLTVLAVRRFDENSHILGFFFASFGAGALVGSLFAAQIVRKVKLTRLAGVAIVAMAVPLWLLALTLPWPAVMVVLAAFGFCAPLVNAPIFAILTVRVPPPLRPKVMTAVMTIAQVIGPLGFLAVGVALQHVGMQIVFLAIAAGFSAAALAFSAAVRGGDAREEVGDTRPAADLAAVLPVEAGAD